MAAQELGGGERPAVSSAPIARLRTSATGPASISRSTRITEMPVSRSPARIA